MIARVCFSASIERRLQTIDARIALLNWLFARHEGGDFALRIEDAGSSSTPDTVCDICDELRWLGLDWDEGPVHQSERIALYRRCAQRLVESGQAYRCYCTPTDWSRDFCCRCQALTHSQRAEREARGARPAVRLCSPSHGQIAFDDLVLGTQSVLSDALGDTLLLTPDGLPTPCLSGVVDDHDMAITHVIRSRDKLSDTPLYLCLCEALGWDRPTFAHLPLVVTSDGSKPALDTYREDGYLPLAIANDLARWGWTPRGKRELLSMAALAERFELQRVSHSDPVPDPHQLDWFNRRYLSQLDKAEVAHLMIPYWRAAYGVPDRAVGTALTPEEWQQVLACSILGEVGALSNVAERVRFAFDDVLVWDVDAARMLGQPYAGEVLHAFVAGVPEVVPFTSAPIDAFVSDLRWRFKARHHIRSRDVMHVIRAALTGNCGGPCLVDVCQLLGKERCVRRARKALRDRHA